MTAPYGLWTLDENPAQHDTTIVDSGSSGTNGTLKTGDGATNKSVTGKLGQGIQFDGTDDYLDTAGGAAFDFNLQSFTVTAWIKDVTAARVLASKGGTTDSGGWMVVVSSTGLEVVTRRTDGTSSLDVFTSGVQPFNDGNWHHVAAVIYFDTVTAGNNTASLYVDGVVQSTSNTGDGFAPELSSKTLKWATRTSSAGSLGLYYAGKLDDARIYNVALSSAEIAELAGTVYSATFGQLLASSGMVGRIYV